MLSKVIPLQLQICNTFEDLFKKGFRNFEIEFKEIGGFKEAKLYGKKDDLEGVIAFKYRNNLKIEKMFNWCVDWINKKSSK